MVSVFSELTIDCRDARRLARFWADVLDHAVTVHEPGLVEVAGPTRPRLIFCEVPDEKTVKNRLHIDVNPVDRDRDTEVSRLVALGATHVDIGQGEAPWVVLADPEGNEFCVLGTRVEIDPCPTCGVLRQVRDDAAPTHDELVD